MNENLNLVKILKDCPKGTKLYSPIFGEVEFEGVYNDATYPIVASYSDGFERFTKDGRLFYRCDGECTLFPSKEQRDWSKFNPKKPKFDPKTLQPFDKVLARDEENEYWRCTLFSHIVRDEETYPYACSYDMFTYCIPYNDETKHLVGTADEAPEFYRYWED